MPERGRLVCIESLRQVRDGCFPQGRRAAEAVGMAPRTPRTPRETNTGRQVGSLALRSLREFNAAPQPPRVGARTARPHHGETRSLGQTRRPQSPLRDLAGRSPRQGTDLPFLLRFQPNRPAKLPYWPLCSGGLCVFILRHPAMPIVSARIPLRPSVRGSSMSSALSMSSACGVSPQLPSTLSPFPPVALRHTPSASCAGVVGVFVNGGANGLRNSHEQSTRNHIH